MVVFFNAYNAIVGVVFLLVNYEKSEPYDMMILSAFSSAAIYIIILTTTISLLIKGLLSKRKAEPNK